ncbi:MAG TPA: glutathione transferase GstA [Kofleriaceae bacterium]|nr:glutathione transferase GstA [Kofleriaceae bacterium]
MKLYYAPGRCSLAAHIALREADLRFDLERVDLGTLRTASGRNFRDLNPKADIPLLELDGGEMLTETPVVLAYIADHAPDSHLGPPAGVSMIRYHFHEWLAFIASELHAPFTLLFDPTTPAHVQAMLRGKISDRLLYTQKVLEDRAFLMGESFSAADAYLFVMLQWCERFGMDLPLWPNIDTYESKIAHRPTVEATLAAEGLLDRHRHFRRTA